MQTDPMLQVDVLRIKDELHIDTFVETGTENALTTKIVQWYFKKIYTCEIDLEKINNFYGQWVKNENVELVNNRDVDVLISYKDYKKEQYFRWHNSDSNADVIKLYPKSSLDCLEEIITEIGHDDFILYLDSHIDYQEVVDYIPLLDELEIVAQTGMKPFIVIHDFHNSSDEFRLGSIYDNDKELSYDLVKNNIIKIYGEDGYFYRESVESYVTGNCKIGSGYFWKKEFGNIFEKYDMK